MVGNLLVWESLDAWTTPNDRFFTVKHYNQPALSADTWTLTIDGLVDHPQKLDLAELKRRPQDDVDFTLECSGNTGLPFAIGAVGNARWTGTRLSQILKAAKPRRQWC